MQKLQPTLTINMNDEVYEVANMSPAVQGIVAMFDDWRQELADTEQKVVLYRVALARLQQELADVITKEKEAAAAPAEETPAEEAPAAE